MPKLEKLNKWQRWMKLLRHLDRKGQTVQQLTDRLRAEGIEVSVRTVQRDLKEMLEAHEGVESRGDKPIEWRWAEDATWASPEVDTTQAVAWALLEQYAVNLLPPAWFRGLTPFFNAARRGMTQSERAWLERVRVIPTAFSLQQPKIDLKVRDYVCEALKSSRQLRFTYRKGGVDEVHYEAVNPLALAQRDRELILVATHERSNGAPREFPIHRILGDIAVTDTRAIRPARFSIDDYIRTGGFQYSDGTLQIVTLDVAPWLVARLRETPLSDDQKIQSTSDGRALVTATVPKSLGFVWWLAGLGEDAQMVSNHVDGEQFPRAKERDATK